MTPFISLPQCVRAIFLFWDLLLCLVGIVTIIDARGDRKYGIMCLDIVLMGVPFLWWQVIGDISEFRSIEVMHEFCQTLARCPVNLCVSLHSMITVLLLFIMIQLRRYHKNHVSPSAIRIFADNMPCGICYWNDYGRVIFSNSCMNQLCTSVLGEPLLDGLSFQKSVTDIMTINNRIWQMKVKDLFFNGETLHEMIATDITDIYQKTIELKKENEEITNFTKELREFSLNIDDMVRREEILRAKINIHDEMNRLMLMTDSVNLLDVDAIDNIFAMWERNALLMCMETDDDSFKNKIKRVEQLANVLGINLIWQKQIPESMSVCQRELLFMAVQEALANVAKHTAEKEIIFSFDETDTAIFCYFKNKNTKATEKIVFTGGLLNLERLAKKQNARLKVECNEAFVLTLQLEKQNRS